MTTLPRFDQPANYRITVLGHLDGEWIDYLHGMTIDNRRDREVKVATVTGRLPDQAALIGLLNTLYDAHVTVLAVESLGIAEDALDLFGFPEALQ